MPDAFWLALRRVRGVGPRISRLLLEHFHSAEQIFAASEADLSALGIPRTTARNLTQFNDFAPLEKELCELPRIGARLVRWTDHEYPAHLRHIPDPPPYFMIRGTIAADDPKLIAVVGARAASDAGRRMARRLGLELAAKGFTVVSGLARGIDCEAHQGAFDGGGKTAAVMGCGIDIVYPPENKKLAEAMIENGGALISELPLGTPPIPENFPSRNRLISGLCLGVIVVEAAERSGSLITARMALDQNRQVFAVPGSPLTGKTRGSNRLLKEGARLVECVEDVIEELVPQLAPRASRPEFQPAPHKELNDSDAAAEPSGTRSKRDGELVGAGSTDATTILQCLKGADKLHIDSTIESSGLTVATVLKLLLELELKGVVTQQPGKLFSLNPI
ncbi:MAG: DNA-protecting protein DprA [Deltaproteobacteria bacterium]|nr:DNA-protecting protein DprA [Deltaproteobacteria bacterium]